MVAVKTLRANASPSERRELLEEAALMAQFDHPNVMRLVGVCTVINPPRVAMVYAEHGALVSALRCGSWRAHFSDRRVFERRVGHEVALGCAYLAAQNFVHRDIAARNVLIETEYRFLVADFGLSRKVKGKTYYYNKETAMPIRWTAPEVLQSGRFSSASDVWSFGVLMQAGTSAAE